MDFNFSSRSYSYNKPALIHLNCLGKKTIEKGEEYPRAELMAMDYHFSWEKGRQLNEFHIVWILKGEGVLEVNRKESISVREGSLWILSPKQWHRYKPNKAIGWTESWIGISGSYCEQAIASLLNNRGFLVCDFQQLSLLNEKIQQLYSLTKKYHTETLKVQSGIIQLLSLIEEQVEGFHLKNHETDFILRAQQLIYDNMAAGISRDQICAQLKVSNSTLIRSFKKICKESPKDYEMRLKTERAKLLLKSTQMTLDEISDQCGFSSAFHLSKYFKSKVGVSPKEFRTGYRG